MKNLSFVYKKLNEKEYFAPFVKTKAFFLLRMHQPHFPLCISGSFPQNFVVFFLFIYLFFILNFLFIYSFPTNSWKMEAIYSIIIRVRLLSEKNDLLNFFFLINVIFLDNKYIKTLLNSNKILSENFKPISAIKLEIIG